MGNRCTYLFLVLGIFYLLYSLSNIYSASLYEHTPNAVHILATSLDSHINFIPTMIVPYGWSLLLFCASFFMVNTHKQLTLLTYRLILATLFACLIFYLYPARFSFTRPVITSWVDLGYQFLALTDKPYNQFPSLHVTYAILLAISLWPLGKHYYVILQLSYRVLLTLVCGLIIISTVFTYQHHLLDVIGGFVLAAVVYFLANKIGNHLVIRYLTVAITGFLLLAIAGYFVGLSVATDLGMVMDSKASQFINSQFINKLVKYGFLIIASYWLLSFLAVAWAYQYPDIQRDAVWFSKDAQGKLTLLTWFKFAPLLLSYRLMWWGVAYFKGSQFLPSQSKISQNLFDQNMPNKDAPSFFAITKQTLSIATPRLTTANCEDMVKVLYDNFALSAKNSQAQHLQCHVHLIVVDVATEISSHFADMAKTINARKTLQNSTSCEIKCITDYLYFPLLDLQSLSVLDVEVLLRLFRQIDTLCLTRQCQQQSAPTLTLINFHCVMGLSRSISIHLLYLLYCGKLSVDDCQNRQDGQNWLAYYYPQAHISDDFLPQSLLRQVDELGHRNKYRQINANDLHTN